MQVIIEWAQNENVMLYMTTIDGYRGLYMFMGGYIYIYMTAIGLLVDMGDCTWL